jgi:ribonuclease Z
MKITFLGTSSMVPTKERAHTSLLINYKNENILIDAGENVQRQLKLADISPTRVTKILISHWHGDHVLGLPGLIETLGAGEYKRTLEIYGPKKTKQFIRELVKIYHLENKIKIEIYEINSGKFINEKDFYIEAKPLKHNIPTLAYNFVIKDKIRIKKPLIKKLKIKGPILKKLAQGKDIKYKGKTIKAKQATYIQKGKKVSIILDTKYFPSLSNIAKNADLLISESTYTEEHKIKAKHYLHLTSSQAATTAKKAKVKQLILTHFSQRYKTTDHLLKEAKKIFKNTTCAKDFMSIAL